MGSGPAGVPGTDPDDAAFSARRAAVERLAASVRALAEVATETAVAPAEIDAVTAAIDGLAERLGCVRDTTPYSNLVQPGVDRSRPENPMPLNPIIGACSPVRPDVRLWFEGLDVRGTAVFGKRFTGPPGFCHGGISAMLADQIVAVTPMPHGWSCITRELHVDYRRALPLGEPLELAGECRMEGDEVMASCEVRAGEKVAVSATARLVPFDRLARRHGLPTSRPSMPSRSGEGAGASGAAPPAPPTTDA
jgi:uncharacterized protein (TIGR00369 family)